MNDSIPDRGLLVSHIHDQFWSEEYYEAAQLLRAWKSERGESWAQEFFTCLADLEQLTEPERDVTRRTNAARRLIKSRFRKTQQLCSRGFLTEDDLREHLTMAPRLEMVFLIIEPLERARKTDYKREMFDFYDRLHGNELDRPER